MTLILADARNIPLDDETVQCVVTSPPYWGLRDYGHKNQIGLEPTPELYVSTLVEVFQEVRRVLREDGTVWLNLGDSYCHDSKWGGRSGGKNVSALHTQPEERRYPRSSGRGVSGCKDKDLVGIPWRVAFALQADGWYLRSDIIWSKPNPMPESVTDRPTKAHEYIFLLSKRARYFFDAEAVREPTDCDVPPQEYEGKSIRWCGKGPMIGSHGTVANDGRGMRMPSKWNNPSGRNIRTVWTIATQPYSGAHFATFPEQLVERCVKAGTSEHGCCTECGAPWGRVVERIIDREIPAAPPGDGDFSRGGRRYRAPGQPLNAERVVSTTGWRSTCSHNSPGGKCVVLDPFCGSGTTIKVATKLGRRAVGLDISDEYLDLAEHRVKSLKPPSDEQPSLFEGRT